MKQVLNVAAANRIISKQECVVLLGELDLYHCSETIRSVSLSGGRNFTATKNDSGTKKQSFINNYILRSKEQEHLSVHEYFSKNCGETSKGKRIIPHYVGIMGQPVYPVTTNYAKAVCITYKPFRRLDHNRDWITEFNAFLQDPRCPIPVKMGYNRVLDRFHKKTTHVQPLSHECDTSKNPIAFEDQELMAMCSQSALTDSHLIDFDLLRHFNRGEKYDWSQEDKTKVGHLFLFLSITLENITRFIQLSI